MEIDKELVGKRINNIRLNKGWTLEELGKRLNTSKVTVFNWENGRNLPNKENLKLLADIAEITVDELLYGTKDEIAMYAIDDALEKFINSRTEFSISYEYDKQRYDELLRSLLLEYMVEGHQLSDVVGDYHNYVKNRTLKILEEEFSKGDRNDENMLNYLYHIFINARNKVYSYLDDPLTKKAIKNGDIKNSKFLEQIISKLSKTIDEIEEQL